MKGFVTKAVSSTVPRARVLFNGVQNGPLLKACVDSSKKANSKSIKPRGEVIFGARSSLPHMTSSLSTEKMPRQETVVFPAQTKFPRKITWLAGAPGAGKGTNSVLIADTLGYKAPTIVMSSLLDSPECKRIKDAGGMVDDAVVCRVLLEELAKPQYRQGVVVDGFPRTEQQAAWLRSMHNILSTSTNSPPKFNFVMLYIDEQASIARQLARGEATRKLNSLRMKEGLVPVEERATDACVNVARARYHAFLEQYEAVTKHVAAFPLSVVDASAPLEVVRKRLVSSLEPMTTRCSRPLNKYTEVELPDYYAHGKGNKNIFMQIN